MNLLIFEKGLKDFIFTIFECMDGSTIKEEYFGVLLKNNFNISTLTNFSIINFDVNLDGEMFYEIQKFYNHKTHVIFFIQPEFISFFNKSIYTIECFQLMYFPLDRMIPPNPKYIDVHISQVSINNFKDYYAILSEEHSFEYEDIFILFSSLTSNSNCIFLIAYLEGIPVSVRTILFHDTFTQGLLSVTKKEYQRRGIGSALMIYALQLSKVRGYKYFILQATEVANRAWSKLGFIPCKTLYSAKSK